MGNTLTAQRGYSIPAATGTYRHQVVVIVSGAAQQGSDRRAQGVGDDGARSDTRRTWARRRDAARYEQRLAAGKVRGR